MLAKQRGLRVVLSLVVALGGVIGCLVVSPLDDLPASAGSSAGGKGSGGKSAGGKSAGGSSQGGAGNVAVGGAAGDGAAPSAGATGSDGECQTNAECSQRNFDNPYRCRPSDHTCVPLIADACPLSFGDATDPNAIFFGAFATLSAGVPEDNSIIWSHRLALEELGGKNVGGLPGGPNGVRRPLVMIVCDNSDAAVAPALQHLVEDVEVPAVIGTLKPGDLRQGFETYRKHDVFYLSPVSVTSPVADEDDDGLIWNFLGQPSDLAPTYVELLKLVEARVRHERNLQPGDKIKVALLTTKDAFDSELNDAVAPGLLFNKLSAQANGSDFFPILLDPTETPLDTTAQDLATFGPDVVISAASELFSMDNGLLESLEDNWDPIQHDKPRPLYILSPYNAGDLQNLIQLMNAYIDGGTELDPEQRFVGVSIAGPRDNTLQNDYARRLRTLFKDAYPDTANYYDATYFLAYAMYGAGTDTALSGSSIAQGMKRLLDGNSVDVGPTAISSTFKTLSTAGSKVHLASTLGPPDFDAASGVRPVDGSVLCFEKKGSTVDFRTDVLRYDSDIRGLVGTFPCFTGFYP